MAFSDIDIGLVPVSPPQLWSSSTLRGEAYVLPSVELSSVSNLIAIPNIGNVLSRPTNVESHSTVEISTYGSVMSDTATLPSLNDEAKRLSDHLKQSHTHHASLLGVEHSSSVLGVSMTETLKSMRNPGYRPNALALIEEAGQFHTKITLFNAITSGLTKALNKLLAATS